MESFEKQLSFFELKMQSMNDQELVGQVGSLFTREKRIGDVILLGLKEIKARRIYAAMAYASLFEMLVKHFKLSESSAYTRLQALKLMEAVPEVQGDLFTGALSLTNAALVQGFIQQSEKEAQAPLSTEAKKEIIEAVKGKSQKEARATLADKNPQAGLPPNREKPLALNHTQLQITIDAETLKALTEVKELLSHRIPDGDMKEVLKYMIQLTSETLKKRQGRSSSEPKPEPKKKPIADRTAPSMPGSGRGKKNKCVRSRFIPIEIKRKVFARSGGCCEYTSADGKRCQSKHQLEFDHIIPFSQGGDHHVDSLRICCRIHNQYRTKETHGFWYIPKVE